MARGHDQRRADMPGRLAEVAMRYAEHGWPVIPLHTPGTHGCSCAVEVCTSPGKHPRTRHGLHDATVSTDQVRQWWARWPDANIGVVTGRTSGLLVLDIDLPDGPTELHQLETTHQRLPVTCTQQTGSGGRQLLFVHPEAKIGNRTGVAPGIDVRADGGYIVVPPSRHVLGGRYQWLVKAPPASPPAWLVDQLTRQEAEHRRAADRPTVPDLTAKGTSRYAAVALDRELERLAAAGEGTRNHALNRAAFNLGQLVGAGMLDEDSVTARLEAVASEIGLGPVEIRRTIRSGLTAGVDTPRLVHVASERPLVASSPTSQRPPYRALVRRR